MKLSLIVPAKDEEKNINYVYADIKESLKGYNFEIIFIDDGSKDLTYTLMQILNKSDLRAKIIKFKKNYGQTAAWSAGFKHATGDYIITMDADGQNDPTDIPKLIKHLEDNNYDVVSGWRKNRNDNISKRFFSFFANKLRKWFTGDKVNDAGCSLKVYKKECVKNLILYGEMHRYITTLLVLKGYNVGEIEVTHHPRTAGKTKYSSNRLFKGMMDLLLITFWKKYSFRPIHFFGLAGFFSILTGMISGFVAIYLRLFKSVDLSETFLPDISIFLFLMGLFILFFGIIIDILMKIQYKDEDPYLIEVVK